MHKNKLVSELTTIGLTENEAGVYLASLSLGPATIQNIATAAEIKRTTAYTVVDSLMQKGLMNIVVRGFKKFFVPENPERVQQLLETRKERFAGLLPEFSSLYNLEGGESIIKYYEGLEAVKNVYENLLIDIKPYDDYLIIADQSKWIALDEKYFKDFTERRAKLNINIRALQVDSPISRHYKTLEKNLNFTIKFLPTSTELTTNLVITPTTLVIHQLHPPILAIVIQNKSAIKLHKEIFEIMWCLLPE